MSHTTDLLDGLGIRYTLPPVWDGPIWEDGELTYPMDCTGDIGLFHELAHYLLADEWQRELPDLGLGVNVNAARWRYVDDDDPVEWINSGALVSWGDEDRVCKEDAGIQESYSVWAMGLYDLFFDITPEEHKVLIRTMDEYGAWDPIQGMLMRAKDAHEIASTLVSQLNGMVSCTVSEAKIHLCGFVTIQ